MRISAILLLAPALALRPPQRQHTAQHKLKALAKVFAPGLLAAGLFAPSPVRAEGKRQIGSITASGLVFKDKLVIDAFEDPKVEGVTLYVSDFERPVTERLQKDFFSDPSTAGLACSRRAAPLKLGNVDSSPEGEDVVTESKSLLFKTLRVKRVLDKQANALVYVSFATRLNKDDDSNKSRFSSSLCTVPLDPQ
mmetsp:Transcript_27363/g.82102  ORF Transcript_27363/g.82102 Transcript_27363/m.82102 type:complete len:194 (-) Transcript_27363:24-605(-)